MLLTTKKLSLTVDCQTKIVKCDCAAKENFEVKIIVLTFGCILINKVNWESKYLGTQNFWNFVIWRDMNETMLIFVSPCFQFCICAKAVMAACFSFVIEGIKETLEWFQ